jgi:GDP/GTP exchange factor required for growth at low temperature
MSVARDTKEAYSQRPRASISKPSSGAGTPNGAMRKATLGNDEVLDLDFIAEPTPLLENSGFGRAKSVASADGVAVLQQPLHRAIMEHRPSLSASVSPTAAAPSHPPNALSRALANTVGRLGRWKRALNPGSRQASNPASTGVSAFDLELSPEGDLLHVRGGTEQFLNVFETPYQGLGSAAHPVPPTIASLQLTVDPLGPLEPPHSTPPIPPPPVTVNTADTADTADTVDAADTTEPPLPPPDASSARNSLSISDETTNVVQEAEASTSSLPKASLRGKTSSRVSTGSTSSSSSYGVPINPQSTFHTGRSVQDRSWQLDIVSIDDLDLSDTSSILSEGPMPPPGLKRLPRRLPLRRDFEFVDRNRDSVSSMGFASQDESGASASNSRRSSAVSGGMEGVLGSTIQQWQVNALIDSLSEDEDEGDVEDALRRLEGQMNAQKQRANEHKVDNWVRTIRDRLAAGDYGDEAPRYLSDDGEDMASELGTLEDAGVQGSAPISVVSSPSRPGSPASVRRVSSFGLLVESSTPTPGPALPSQPTPTPSTVSRSAGDMKPAIEDVLPPEILQGRLAAPAPVTTVAAPIPSPAPRISTVPGRARSWVLGVSTVALAIHFSMIDRELFLAIKFEELVSDDWRSSEAAQAANVLDWGQFLKDRAHLKAQGVEGYPTSALVAARARFNLLTNFVISEIVDTVPSERPTLAAKFIRVAWVRPN